MVRLDENLAKITLEVEEASDEESLLNEAARLSIQAKIFDDEAAKLEEKRRALINRFASMRNPSSIERELQRLAERCLLSEQAIRESLATGKKLTEISSDGTLGIITSRVVVVALMRNDRVLLQEEQEKAIQRNGKRTLRWGLPGGGVKLDIGESPEEAAMREVEEETGLLSLVTPRDIVLRKSLVDEEKPWGIHEFVGYATDMIAGELAENNGDRVAWSSLKLEELNSFSLLPKHRQVLEAVIKKNHNQRS